MITANQKESRPGYSLVELMVVLGIILGVMGMVIAIYPSYSQREDMFKAGDIVRNSLMRARHWAIRDKAITGIRFDSLPGNLGASLTFVQSPPTLYGSVTNLKMESCTSPMGTVDVYLTKFDQNSGNWIVPTFNPAIKAGDYIVSDKPALIGPPDGTGATTDPFSEGTPAKLRLPLSNSITNNGQTFRILRKPTDIPNEPVIDFSKSIGIVIDLSLAAPNIQKGSSATDPDKGVLLFTALGQANPKNSGIITIKVVQTDPSTPYTKGNIVLNAADSVTLAGLAINETYINIDAATGVSKVLGKSGAQ
jgi:type II secretory pathway pseudopilin PulG